MTIHYEAVLVGFGIGRLFIEYRGIDSESRKD